MDRITVMEFLEEEINKMKEKHVEDLMRANRVEELEEVGNKIDFTILEEYLKEKQILGINSQEVPQDSWLEFIFIIHQSGFDYEKSTYCIWGDLEEILEHLKECSGKLERKIADLMHRKFLADYSLEELLAGK